MRRPSLLKTMFGICVKYHHIRDLVACKDITVARVYSSENAADIMTKPLAKNDFCHLRELLGLHVVGVGSKKEHPS
jgi:hypothetical protein